MIEDPHYQREASRYSKPVASREYLLQIIGSDNKSMMIKDITTHLGIIDPEMIEGVRRRLRAMINDGQLACTPTGGYQLIEKEQLKEGRISGCKEGHGYCLFDDSSESLLIRSQQMRQVFDGDRVLVYASFHHASEETYGIIVDVVQRNTKNLVGYLRFIHSKACVVPLNKRNQHQTISLLNCADDLQEGTLVSLEIVQQPQKTQLALGHICSILDPNNQGYEIDIALLNHRLKYEWSQDALAESLIIDEYIKDEQINQRHDLRDLPFVTIDGKDSKDFDDAVYAIKDGRYYRLYVAIADVSEYVTLGSALDKEAQIRGNSVYFPREVIPMLPERLANGICSLNPNQDRLALVCEILVTAKGKVSNFWLYEGVFSSHARLSYDQVSNYLDSGVEDSRANNWSPEVQANINSLVNVYRALIDNRTLRGALAIEIPEIQFEFSGSEVNQINQVHRTIAHCIIEEAMLVANVCVAQLFSEFKIPILYRVHREPDSSKVEEFRSYLKQSGLRLAGGNKPEPKHFQQLIDQLIDHPNAEFIYSQLLRTMQRAEYSPEQLPHFGLAYQHYCHFTSPIRRYPDLLVHRAIRALIHSSTTSNRIKRFGNTEIWESSQAYPYQNEQLASIGAHCTDTETRAEEASRDVQQYLRCTYLQKFIGNRFQGVIKTITSFGMFIEMQGTYSEGLLHISQLGDDYYLFDKETMTLHGERTGKTHRLGDLLEVKLVRVDIEQGMIDLEPVTKANRPNRRRKLKQSKR